MAGKNKKMNSRSQDRIHELDALRGLAALMIFIFHCSLLIHFEFFYFGVTGVDLFFMISGFVIMMSVERNNDWRHFIVKRVTRIYPAFWVCVSITAILIIVNEFVNSKNTLGFVKQYLANMTMLPSYFNMPYLDEQYWTLEVELLFYLFIVFVLIFQREDHLEKVGYVALGTIFFYSVIIQPYFSSIYELLDRYMPLLNHFPLFFAGMLFYKQRQQEEWERYIGILLCFLLTLLLFDHSGRSHFYVSINLYVLSSITYFVIFFFLNKKGIVTPLRWPPILFIGRISYPLYLIHQYFSAVIIRYIVNHLRVSFFVAVLVALILTVLIAYLVTRFIEEPALLRVKKKISRDLNY